MALDGPYLERADRSSGRRCSISGRLLGRRDRRQLASLYGELLGMRRIDIGTRRSRLRGGPTPAHPEQIHLDLGFDDVDAAPALAVRPGAIRLEHSPETVYADPAAHPFCLGGNEEPDPSWTDIHRPVARRPDKLRLGIAGGEGGGAKYPCCRPAEV